MSHSCLLVYVYFWGEEKNTILVAVMFQVSLVAILLQ